jgi:hypothetical protein
MPAGLTDLQRLISSELVYTGARRTPVCAIVQTVPLAVPPGSSVNQSVPVAAELFATSLDVHLLNGDLPEDSSDLDTADGRPALRSASLNRLAHQICCDSTDLSEVQIQGVAAYVAERQIYQIAQAIRKQLVAVRQQVPVAEHHSVQILISGSGGWMAEKAIATLHDEGISTVTDLSVMFVRNVSACAPAFAAARLASERCMDDLLPLSALY